MAVKPTEIDDSRLKLAGPAVPGERLRYEICGFAVHSEVRLPIPELTRSVEFAPAWVIRMHESDVPAPLDPATQSASSSDGRHDIPGTAFTTCLDATGSWWWWDGVGTFHISTDARFVDVYCKSGVDERNLGLILTGPLASFVMYRLGHPTLHGSAVVTSQGAVMFLGAGGFGKSTLAAAFVNRGMRLLADDLLPLSLQDDAIYVRPSIPVMKLWPSSAAGALGLRPHELPNVSAHLEKKLLAMNGVRALAKEPARLRAVYLLDRYEPAPGDERRVEIRRLSGREGMTVILAQLPCGSFLQPHEATGFLPFFARLVRQAPVRILKYPGDFGRLDATCERILDDVMESPLT